MKVFITNQLVERDETLPSGWRSWFKTPKKIKEYQVILKLDLNEEERAILTEYELWDSVIYYDDGNLPPDVIAAYPVLSDLPSDVPHTIKSFASEKTDSIQISNLQLRRLTSSTDSNMSTSPR